MNDVMDDIADILASQGVSVWGTGPSAPLEDQRAGYRPSDLVPEARSVVCFGMCVPRAIFDHKRHAIETVWRTQNLYYKELDTISIRLAAALEEKGAQSIPVFGCYPMDITALLSVAGYLDLVRMGEATRIGTRGKNGVLFHPRYGCRLMLGGVVTAANLPRRTEPVTVETGCPSDCRRCVDACPVKAICPEDKQVNMPVCLRHTSRNVLLPKARFLALSLFNRKKAARLMNLTAMDDHTLHVCSRCISVCPENIDDQTPPIQE